MSGTDDVTVKLLTHLLLGQPHKIAEQVALALRDDASELGDMDRTDVRDRVLVEIKRIQTN